MSVIVVIIVFKFSDFCMQEILYALTSYIQADCQWHFRRSWHIMWLIHLANHHVQVLNYALRFISMFGREGSGKGQFDRPLGVTSDSTGRVYVADTANNAFKSSQLKGSY